MTTRDANPDSARHAPDNTRAPQLRRRLHDVAGQLSIAVLQLGVALEDARLDPATRESLVGSLDACHDAAASLREVWRLIDKPSADG
jgi:hypothetical protein